MMTTKSPTQIDVATLVAVFKQLERQARANATIAGEYRAKFYAAVDETTEQLQAYLRLARDFDMRAAALRVGIEQLSEKLNLDDPFLCDYCEEPLEDGAQHVVSDGGIFCSIECEEDDAEARELAAEEEAAENRARDDAPRDRNE